MTKNTRELLEEQLDLCDWQAIDPHYQAGVVICVAGKLDLIAVAIAFSEDDKDSVGTWLEAGEVSKAKAQKAELWAKMPDKQFRVLIVRPFVLIQEPLLN